MREVTGHFHLAGRTPTLPHAPTRYSPSHHSPSHPCARELSQVRRSVKRVPPHREVRRPARAALAPAIWLPVLTPDGAQRLAGGLWLTPSRSRDGAKSVPSTAQLAEERRAG